MSFPDVLLSQFGSLDLEGYPSAAPAYAPRRRGGRGGSLDATAKPFTPCSHSSSTHTSSTSTAVPSASAVLPTELLYHLSTFIESRKTLRSLCLVNSTFLEIALPLLYESLVVISGAVLKGVLSMPNLRLPSLSYLHPRLSLDKVTSLTLHLPMTLPALPALIASRASSLLFPKLLNLNLLFSTPPQPYASSPSRRSSKLCPLTPIQAFLLSLHPQDVFFSRSDGNETDRVLVLPLLADTLLDLLDAWFTPNNRSRTLRSITYTGVLLDPQHAHRSVSSLFFSALPFSPLRQTWDFSKMKRREDVLMSVELVKEGWLELDDADEPRCAVEAEEERGRWSLVLQAEQERWVREGWGGQGGGRDDGWDVGMFEILVV